MPRPARVEPFHFVVVDDDAHLFSILGPMSDDTPWNKRVCDAQEKGRSVRCYTADRSKPKQKIIDESSANLVLPTVLTSGSNYGLCEFAF